MASCHGSLFNESPCHFAYFSAFIQRWFYLNYGRNVTASNEMIKNTLHQQKRETIKIYFLMWLLFLFWHTGQIYYNFVSQILFPLIVDSIMAYYFLCLSSEIYTILLIRLQFPRFHGGRQQSEKNRENRNFKEDQNTCTWKKTF